MKKYKSSASRLANLFHKSRDKWKERSAQKQRRVRELEIQVRDLSASRDHWKDKVREAEAARQRAERELAIKEGRRPEGKGKLAVVEREPNRNEDEPEVKEGELLRCGEEASGREEEVDQWEAPHGHRYPLVLIKLAIQLIHTALVGLRGCERSLGLMGPLLGLPAPTFDSGRQWLFRLGLYLLERPPEKRSDWLVILDMTVELGEAKCLVMVGIPQARLARLGAAQSSGEGPPHLALTHRSVEVLGIEVMTHANGERIAAHLETLAERIGAPRQLIADHGSDLKKGIELFQQHHPETIYTYDVTHRMALLFKHHLGKDERYQGFAKHCATTAAKLQQTAQNFLKPPSARSKSRWLNLGQSIDWAQRMLAYRARGDFTEISPAYRLDAATFLQLVSELDEPTYLRLSAQVTWQDYPHQEAFRQALIKGIGPVAFQRYQTELYHAADLGRRLFEQRFGWLNAYRSEIAEYAQLVDLAHLVEKQLKSQGLTPDAPLTFEKLSRHQILTTPRTRQFKQEILDYLTAETQSLPKDSDQPFLATSDVIESLFGKYKLHTAKSPLKEIGKWILVIPLATVEITSQLVKTAMESIRTIDVERWAAKVFGRSALAKRRAALGQSAGHPAESDHPPDEQTGRAELTNYDTKVA
ncbi:MAG: hypothetical protein GY807_05910 [Gammaproteobacteria bacterium]|nr:hypothetical protein [Gammaproteobacteria bacterium]